MTEPVQEANLEALRVQAKEIVSELGLVESSGIRIRPVSGHNSSLLYPCEGSGGKRFLLKLFAPPTDGRFYPSGVKLEDYARREGAFYRFLDSLDPQRKQMPAPRTILLDSKDPPRWILLERITPAVGPIEEVLGLDDVFELMRKMQQVPLDLLLGRRDFPMSHWDVLGYRDRVRLMYDPVLFVIGERRWTRTQEFYKEALRWTETRKPVLVHGDFTEQNMLVDEEGRAYLVDFERVGTGSEDHDIAWFWIHTQRSQAWKRRLLDAYFEERKGSARIRAEWGIRSALVYLALRRLRFGYLVHGDEDGNSGANLALLDAALEGGEALFPR